MVLIREISKLKFPGPRIVPTPLSPYRVGTPLNPAATEFGAFGAAQNALQTGLTIRAISGFLVQVTELQVIMISGGIILLLTNGHG